MHVYEGGMHVCGGKVGYMCMCEGFVWGVCGGMCLWGGEQSSILGCSLGAVHLVFKTGLSLVPGAH